MFFEITVWFLRFRAINRLTSMQGNDYPTDLAGIAPEEGGAPRRPELVNMLLRISTLGASKLTPPLRMGLP